MLGLRVVVNKVKELFGSGTEHWSRSRIFWIGIVAFAVGLLESNYMTAGLGIVQSILRLTNFVKINLLRK